MSTCSSPCIWAWVAPRGGVPAHHRLDGEFEAARNVHRSSRARRHVTGAGETSLLGAATAAVALHRCRTSQGTRAWVNVGLLRSGTSSNIIPDHAEMLLETRADDGSVNDDLEARARAVLAGAATTYGLHLDVELVGAVTTAANRPQSRSAGRGGGARRGPGSRAVDKPGCER